MTTQSVMAKTANLFGNAAGNVTNKGKQNGSGFDLLIGSSTKAQNPSDTQTTVMKTSVQKKDNYFSKQSDDATDVTGQDDKQQTKAAEPTKNTDTDKLTDNAKTENTKTDNTVDVKKCDDPQEKATDGNTVDQQLLAQITTMLQNVSNAIMEKLNLSPQEFNQLLKQQGMTAADLLDQGNLQKFILANSGEPNILSVLTDENLSNMMKDLMKQVNEIVTEAKIPMTVSQIKEFLTKAEAADTMQEQKNPVNETLVQTADEQTTDKLTGTEKSADVKVSEQPDAVNTSATDTSKLTGNKTEMKEATDKNSMAATQTENQKTNVSGSQKASSDGNNKDMKASDPFQAFIGNMVKAAENNKIEFAESMNQVANIREIANQIIDSIKIAVTPDQTSMEMQLNPENLGKVNLSVQSKDGVLTAQFVVQNQISKEAIESQLNTLRETLNHQGIKVDAIEVTVSANAFDHGNRESGQNQTDSQKNNSGRHITLEDALDMTELPEEDSTPQDITGTLGSQIDYTA